MMLRKLFIGGLFPEVKEEQLRQRFSTYGTISDIEIKTKNDESGTPANTFAYMEIDATDKDLQKCFRAYNKTKWKGCVLTVRNAKENDVKKSEAERQDGSQSSQQVTEAPGVVDFTMEEAGTSVKRDWFAGKYDRRTPVGNSKYQDKRTYLKDTPTKYPPNERRFDEDQSDDMDNGRTNEHTLPIDEYSSGLPKKRKRDSNKWSATKRKPDLDNASEEIGDDEAGIGDHSFTQVKSSESRNTMLDGSEKMRMSKKSAQSGVKSGLKENRTKKVKKKGETSDDGYDSAATDEIIAVSKKQRRNFNLQASDASHSDSVKKTKSPLKANPMQEKLLALSLAKPTTSRVGGINEKQDDDNNENDSVAKPLKFGLEYKKPPSTTTDEEILTEFRGTKFLDEEPDTHRMTNMQTRLDMKPSSSYGSGKHSESTIKPNPLHEKLMAFSQNQNSQSSPSTEFGRKRVWETESSARTFEGNAGFKSMTNKNYNNSYNNSFNTVDYSDDGDSDFESLLRKEMGKTHSMSESAAKALAKDEQIGADSTSDSESDSDTLGSSGELKTPKVLSSPKLPKEVLSSPKLPKEVLSPPKLPKEVLSSPKLPKEVLSSPTLPKEVLSSPKLPKEVLSSPKLPKENKNVKSVTKKQKLKRGTKFGDGDEKSNDSDSDSYSASSADTDEILTSRLEKQKKTVESKGKSRTSVGRVHPSRFDEYSSGLIPGSDAAENSLNFVAENRDIEESSEEEESDFELFVKKELLKSKQQNKTKFTQKKLARKSELNTDSNLVRNRKLAPELKETPALRITTGFDGSESSDVIRQETLKQVSNRKLASELKETPMLKTTTDFLGSAGKAKSKSSDVKRQETLQQRHKEHLAQKSAVQKALSNLDRGVRSNKKIVFDSDSDSEDATAQEPVKRPVHYDLEEEYTAKKEMNIKKSKGAGLFDDSSDEDQDVEQDQQMFTVRPEFQGTAGKKLMALQSRYGNDERFKLDTRFAESDSEADENPIEEEDEKTKQLKILASVLGSSAGIALGKRDKSKKTFKDISQLHFDPTKDEHSQLEIKTDPKDKKEKRKKKTAAEEEGEPDIESEVQSNWEPDLPEVSKERFFEMSDSIKDAFKKREEPKSEGFSLLAAFGRKVESDEEMEEDATEKPFTSVLDPLSLDSRFNVDENDSEQEEAQNLPIDWDSHDTQKLTSGDAIPEPSTFFFTEDDPRLKEGDKFYRTEDMDTVREKWLKKRPQLVESYRLIHRRFRRKLKNQEQFKPNQGKKFKKR